MFAPSEGQLLVFQKGIPAGRKLGQTDTDVFNRFSFNPVHQEERSREGRGWGEPHTWADVPSTSDSGGKPCSSPRKRWQTRAEGTISTCGRVSARGCAGAHSSRLRALGGGLEILGGPLLSLKARTVTACHGKAGSNQAGRDPRGSGQGRSHSLRSLSQAAAVLKTSL